jgi:hypothetical protein
MRENYWEARMGGIHQVAVVSLKVSRVLVGVAAIGLFAVSVPVMVSADQPVPTITVGYQSGKITAVYQTSFQIDGRTYTLTPDAEILDDNGNQLDASYIVKEIEAKFRVKKDQNDKIEKMILILPR